MKNSIKAKLFIGILVFAVFLTLISSFMNINFFDDYYMSQKKKNMLSSVKKFGEEYKNGTINNENLYVEIDKIASRIGGNVVISDIDGKPIISTLRANNSLLQGNQKGQFRQSGLNFEKDAINKIIKNEYYFEVKNHPRFNSKFLYLGYKLSGEELLLVETPMEAIELAANISNKFNLIIGLISLIMGGIIAYAFAKNFTKDIINLTKIAQDISNLDFSKKFNVKTKDEISMLGKSINQMSNTLESTISELENANISLKKDIDIKNRIDIMRKQFISNVSHELKTPIALIQGYAIGLKENVINNTTKKDFYCDVIIDESDKMDKLVKDLLNLSFLDSGMYKVCKKEFDISALVDEVLDKFEPMIRSKKINIRTIKEDIIMVNADELRIEQVVINYLNNAINHVKNPKEVSVSVQNLDENTKNMYSLGNEEVKGSKILSVFNTGESIPQSDIEKIWSSFYKVDKARTREYSGSGLGLSIVKSILDIHGLSYGVRNREDGVEFWFTI
ncbi:sensor histidine kinase [Helicovermis profundi]|uniref:histidine kinase n=1 Tax=Helicovermis profundi TaxID=3065157 RepID=A0AAU9EM11_9FIRM|nr:HAMP domain-containing sensor histidine kinase [Clostridia bacterium S502]